MSQKSSTLCRGLRCWCAHRFKSHPTSTGAILAVLRKLPEGGAVSVAGGEQHGPRQAAPTLAFSHRTQIWERMETRHTSPLWAGRLVWQVLACFTACQAAVITSRQRVWTVWRHQTGSSTLKCLRAVIISHPTLIPTNLWHAHTNTKALTQQKKSQKHDRDALPQKRGFSPFFIPFPGYISSQFHKINESHRDPSLIQWTCHVYTCTKYPPLSLFHLSVMKKR